MVKNLIIGAGPTGLGAAWKLKELNEEDFLVIEKEESAGGLARSFVDDKGFTWDIGGHVQFSHYPYYDKMLSILFQESEWKRHRRSASVYLNGKFHPYPIQNNLAGFDSLTKKKLENDFRNINRETDTKDFGDWLLKGFGATLCREFLFPYNEKVWAHHPKKMNYHWIAERVSYPDKDQLIGALKVSNAQHQWGPNSEFIFPNRGGTGEIWKRAATHIGLKHFQFNTQLVSIDAKQRIITTNAGDQIQFENLLSTIPINLLIYLIEGVNADIEKVAKSFTYSSSLIIGIGVLGEAPEVLCDKTWMYFSEPKFPFYRATLFSSYGEGNTPKAERCWSLMLEIASSKEKPRRELNEEIKLSIQSLIEAGFLKSTELVISTWAYEAPYGYPTPFLERDLSLKQIHQYLESLKIESRGRFGGWKYEVSNQDHSFMQGVQWAEFKINGHKETIYQYS